jgi:hypothetical protein
MAIDNKAVFLLTGAEPARKKAFGTGFAVAYEDGQLYLLTCAHVLDQLSDKVRVSGHEAEAEIMAKGGADSIDLALLRIPCEESPPLLNRTVKGQAEKKFHICGYGPFAGAKDNYVLRDIGGKLGKSIAFESPGSGRVEAWDLHVEDDDFSRLQGGYSGSPLCDEQGRLLAVVSHKIGNEGQRGHAVAIANLQTLYPEIEQLIPGFLDLSNDPPDVDTRIEQAMMQLSVRVMEIFAVMPRIGQEFDRMKNEGIGSEDEKIFETIKAFVEKSLTAEDLMQFFTDLDSREQRAQAGPNYKELAIDLLRDSCVVLCLGQETSHFLGNEAPPPSTAQIIDSLAEAQGTTISLSALCEEKLILDKSRLKLTNRIRNLLKPDEAAQISLYKLLAESEKPFLVISAAYDNLLEQSLLEERRKFVVIYPDMNKDKYLLRYSDQEQTIDCTREDISHRKPLENGYTVVYRLRGGFIDQDQENLLLSERDYFSFSRVKKKFPEYIAIKLQNYALWFLGHHPESWEERLLIKSLQDLRQEKAAPSLAVQEGVSDFARAFWEDSDVKEVHDLALKDFVQELIKEAAA